MPETPTPRLGLRRPLNDGSELVNVQTDLNQNADKLDLAAGFQIVTSSTRPSAPFPGKAISESNTSYRAYLSNGTVPASGSWVQIPTASSTFDSDFTLVAGRQLLIGDTNLYRSAANVLATDDDFAIVVAGKGLRVKEGTNAKMGTATLNGTTNVVIATTAVTATSRIFLQTQVSTATYGAPVVVSRVAGTSFTIKSTTASDTSTVAWVILDPA